MRKEYDLEKTGKGKERSQINPRLTRGRRVRLLQRRASSFLQNKSQRHLRSRASAGVFAVKPVLHQLFECAFDECACQSYLVAIVRERLHISQNHRGSIFRQLFIQPFSA